MKVTIKCPFCGQKYELDEFNQGAEVECAKCGQRFTLELSLVEESEAVGEAVCKPNAPVQPANDSRNGIGEAEKEQEQKAKEEASAGKQAEHSPKNRTSRCIPTFILAMLMYAIAGLAFIEGIDRMDYSPYRSSITDEYRYYGDLIPHLHYQATLKNLEKAKEIEYYVNRNGIQLKAMMFLVIAGVLFAGATIVLAIRSNTMTLIALKHSNADATPTQDNEPEQTV